MIGWRDCRANYDRVCLGRHGEGVLQETGFQFSNQAASWVLFMQAIPASRVIEEGNSIF
jgi:hypothetical protein